MPFNSVYIFYIINIQYKVSDPLPKYEVYMFADQITLF